MTFNKSTYISAAQDSSTSDDEEVDLFNDYKPDEPRKHRSNCKCVFSLEVDRIKHEYMKSNVTNYSRMPSKVTFKPFLDLMR
jgi:hypothetical protein